MTVKRFSISGASEAALGAGQVQHDSGDSSAVDDTMSSLAKVSPEEARSSVQVALGYEFKDGNLLENALTHRSLHVRGMKIDYERLEFLGDAVLDLGVAHLLLDQYTDAREGDLSKMRAALVNTASLADVARRLQIGQFIRLSPGELASGGADRPSILADVVEALIGAIYREAGFERALLAIGKIFEGQLSCVTPQDPKTELQEELHADGSSAPEYLLECVEGPEHAPNFVSIIKVDGQIVGRGRGSTKKASQQAAASEALLRLRAGDTLDQQFLKPIKPKQEGE